MRIPPERLARIDGEAPSFGFNVSRISLDDKMRRAGTGVRKQIATDHQGSFAVFEEAVKFMIAFEAFQFERKDRTEECAPFIMMLARCRSDLIAIRHLLLAGQESSALAIARVFLEDIELTMATAVSPEFASRFMDAEAADAFWSKHIGYGRIYPYVERFLHLGKQGKKVSAVHVAHHKAMKTFLSEYVHPTFGSAFRLVAPRAIGHPGHFANRPMGWFGEIGGSLCLHVAEEVQAFSATCINAFMKPNPPPALENYKPCKALETFMRPAHNLQTLLVKYSRRMFSEYEKKSTRWTEGGDLAG